jgi:hypothetical protein
LRAAAAALLAALALTGCETTAEKSASLEHAAKQLAAHRRSAPSAIAFTRPSAVVKVLSATLVHSSEGTAAVITLRNTSARALRTMPIALTVKDASGRTLFQNNAAGLEAGLVSLSSLAPHTTLTWVDDQVPVNGAPAAVSARVGEAQGRAANLPLITVTGLHQIEDPTNGIGAAGTVSNTSSTTQRNLVVFVLARRGAATAAAGRAVVPEIAAHSTQTFTAFLIGDQRGASLQASAPATTLP